MTVAKRDLETRQNQTFEHTVHLYDKTETALALNGYSAHMQVREDADSEDVILEFSSIGDNGLRIGDDDSLDQGKIFLSKSSTIISALEPGSYRYDLFLISASGRHYPIMYGKFKVIASITKES